ncbi:MFS transporter [Paenibacillus sp. MBLB4367]|uniref:MFS transporter n=1 Tax=Paenibacillus sp. MBLB4367 TaxID=3384767 RepID=UPI003907ECB8
MARWQINLAVLGTGQFFVNAGMTMIIPFLPLYLQEMGMRDNHQIALWASIIFSANFLTSFVFQPIWGNLADRYGCKLMVLRSGFGMAVVMTLMGFAGGAWHLLLLRLINGIVSGFSPASISLMSKNTPRDKIGFTMGTLQAGGVAGTILGPFLGGMLAGRFGYRPIFYMTGGLILIASLLALLLVKEERPVKSMKERANSPLFGGFRPLFQIPELFMLNTTTVVIQLALLSPIALIPLFVQELHQQAASVAFYAGLASSVNGLSNIFASPLLGKLGDKVGASRILYFSLIGSAVVCIPQAFVTDIWQLLAVRFLLGLFMGGLLPSINTLIGSYTPEAAESRSYSLNSSMYALGSLLGPLIGGAVSESFSIRGVFLLSAFLLAGCALWVRIYAIRRI